MPIAVADHQPKIGAFFIIDSAKSVSGLITFWIGHSPEVSDQTTSFRIRKIVKKKRIRSTKIDFPVSPKLWKRLLSLTVTELTHSTTRVAPLVLALIFTPLRLIVD